MTLPSAVRRAIRNGINVVPQVVGVSGKKPLVEWKKYQTEPVTMDQAREWSAMYPNAHWAIVCGVASGYIVLDFDDAKLCERLRLKPLVRTPSGGLHVWVKSPGYEVVGGARVSDAFPMLDLRSDGQLATFSGKGYRRLDGHVYTVDKLPNGLRNLIHDRKRGHREYEEKPLPTAFTDFVPKEELVEEAVERVENGDGRNEVGFWLGCQLRDERYPFDHAWKTLRKFQRVVGASSNGHPYLKQEAYNSLVQAYAQPARQPRSLDDRNTFNRILKNELARDEARNYIRSLKLGVFDPQVVVGLPESDPALTWTLLDLQPENSNALLVAQRKAGKTTVGLNLCRSLLDGTMFLGRFKPRALEGTVAYWNYEMSPRQFHVWLRKANIEMVDQLVHWPMRGEHMDLLDDSTFTRVVELLKQHETEYLIVDPWARAISGIVDENDNSAVAAYLERLDLMKHRAGVRDLVVLAHTGQAQNTEGGERARGASRLEDWADIIWKMAVGDGGKRFFRAEGRDVEVPEFMMDFNKDTIMFNFAGGSRTENALEGAVAEVLKVLRTDPGLTYSALHDQLTAGKNMRPRAIRVAKERGWITVKQDEKHAQRKLHYIKEERHV